MITADTTTTLSRHFRKIEIADGPTVSTKKNHLGAKRAFKVTHLTLVWYDDSLAEHVTASGPHTTKRGKVVNCHRVYSLEDVPRWMRGYILGRE